MARNRKELPLLEKVTITDVAAEGKAIAKVNDLVIFVPYVVPGDVVDLYGTKITKSLTFAMAFPSAATSVIVTFSSRGSSFLFLATFTPV